MQTLLMRKPLLFLYRDILVRGWELLAFASGSFLPTEKLRPYVAAIFLGAQNHDHKPISQLAVRTKDEEKYFPSSRSLSNREREKNAMRFFSSTLLIQVIYLFAIHHPSFLPNSFSSITQNFCLRRLERANLRAGLRGLYRMHVPAMPEIVATKDRKPLIFSVYLADEVKNKEEVEEEEAGSKRKPKSRAESQKPLSYRRLPSTILSLMLPPVQTKRFRFLRRN